MEVGQVSTRPQVFLSWSGSLSQRLADVIKPWLESVHQGLEIFYSRDSIEKGAPWFGATSRGLSASDFGLLVVTPENLVSPWLLFEAGALAKHLDVSRVSPLLFNVDVSELAGPLKQFQATSFTKEEIWRLLLSLNGASRFASLDVARLSRTFEKLWPGIDEAISAILAASGGVSPPKDLMIDVGALPSILNGLYRRVEEQFPPDVVLTMSGPGSFAACYCMSLNARDVPVVMAVTFPKRVEIKEAHHQFRMAAQEAGWIAFETAKWSVYIPDAMLRMRSGTKVLILDDRVISGETQQEAKRLLLGYGMEVRCAAMLATPQAAESQLNFCGRIIDNEYYLPWGPREGRA